MSRVQLPEAQRIESDNALRQMLAEIGGQTPVALDTESNSLYAYRGRVCLVQLSTRERDYIIDPFTIEDMSPLGGLLADQAIEKVFHAAEYDLICLKRDFDFEVHNLFDTMYAARLLRYPAFGLGDLLRNMFGVEMDKSHQRDNWGRRPLAADSLRYAQMDTHFLLQLRDDLLAKLRQDDRMTEAKEVFRDVLRIDANEQKFDPDGFWKLGQPRQLTRRQMACLKELYYVRDQLAQDADSPPYRIIHNNAMIDLAIEQPTNLKELAEIDGLAPAQVRLFGEDFLDALERGQSSNPGKPPRVKMPDPVIAERYITLHAWRKEHGRSRNLESNLILSKQTLWDIAYQMPDTLAALAEIEGIGPWRLEAYGAALLDVIKQLKAAEAVQ